MDEVLKGEAEVVVMLEEEVVVMLEEEVVVMEEDAVCLVKEVEEEVNMVLVREVGMAGELKSDEEGDNEEKKDLHVL